MMNLEDCKFSVTNPENHLPNLIRLVQQSFQQTLEQELAPTGLTAVQWHPIALLGLNKANTAAELAKLVEIDTGAMTRTLDRLEKKELIIRKRSTKDRRVVFIELTPKSLEINKQIFEALERATYTHFGHLSQDEYKTLTFLMQKVLSKVKPDFFK